MLAMKALSNIRTTVPRLKSSHRTPLALQNLRVNSCCFPRDNERRQLHTSHISRDMESAFKAIGAGIAITGVIGPGIGVGTVFGNYCIAVGRNPSMGGQLFNAAIMGAAFCEALGLFAMMISFMVLFT